MDMKPKGETIGRPVPSDSERAAYLGRALACLPEEGTNFLGFQLVSELGRGAFSRVFLAHQTELCNREVALKISVDLFNESQTLAQLQHTNIVPIYSAHSAGPLQALCMPYFGRTTLAEVLKALQADSIPDSGKFLVSMLRGTLLQGALPQTGNATFVESNSAANRLPLNKIEKLSYVHAMLWIVAQVAEGLAHAHDHGIIHRDLKPANILLGDDGQPMLLDFNLSEDVKSRSPGADTKLGGTLPYMAPEQLEAFQGGRRPVDARSDIFSLGVILYEMLTARLPYPLMSGPLSETMPRLAVERSSPAPRLRPWNRAISPAVEAIVLRCLSPNPDRRYQSARDLAEDIERQLENRPLRHVKEPSFKERLGKWLRRHPRLKSPGTFGLLILVGLALFLIPAAWLAWHEFQSASEKTKKERADMARREQRVAALIAAQTGLREFRDTLPAAHKLEEQLLLRQVHDSEGPFSSADLKENLLASRRALDYYQVVDNPSWNDLPQVLDLPLDEEERLRMDVADLLFWLANAYRFDLVPPGKSPESPLVSAWNLNQRAEACFKFQPVPRAILIQKGQLAEQMGKKEAKQILARAEKLPLKTPWDYYTAAFELAAVRKVEEAIVQITKGLALDPKHFPSQLLLAVCWQNLARYGPDRDRLEKAAAAYSTCIALKPAFVPAYLQRGQIYLGDPAEKSWELARTDAEAVLLHRPNSVAARLLHARALYQEAMNRRGNKPPEAVPPATLQASNKILEKAIQKLTGELPGEDPAIYYYRGKMFLALKDQNGAAADFAKLRQLKPASAEGWSFRAFARLAEGEGLPEKSGPENKAKLAAEALADLEHALAIDPGHLQSLVYKASILADLKKSKEAISTLNRIVDLYPDFALARGQRGLLHARLGEWHKAYDDAVRLVERNPEPANYYQAAKIYALTSKFHAWDREHALKLLSFALRNGYGWERFQTDPDLEALRGEAEFQKLVEIAPILGRPWTPRMRPPEKDGKH